MAIDSVRLLTDSAAQLYRRLSAVRPLESAIGPFDEWFGSGARGLDHADEQALRRDYRRLVTLIDEIATLVRSRPRALALVRDRAVAPFGDAAAMSDADAQRLPEQGGPARL